MPATVSNPTKGLLFDLKNSTLTRAVWDDDNNLVEMTYCALTGNVISEKNCETVALKRGFFEQRCPLLALSRH